MKASEVVLINNNTPLTNEERDTLINASYQVTKNSPRRVKRNIDVISYSLRIHDNREILDDPEVLNTILKSINYYEVYTIITFILNAEQTKSKNEKRFSLPEDKYRDPETAVFEFAFDSLVKKCHGKNFERFLTGPHKLDFSNCFNDLAFFYLELEKTGQSHKVAKYLVDADFPIKFLPAQILHSQTFLTTYLEKYGPETSKAIIGCLNDEPFDESQEAEFLRATGTKYKSLNEYVLYEAMNNFSKEDYLFQLAAIKLYTKRLLKINEVDDVTITFNNYHTDRQEFNISGQYDNDSQIEIFLVRPNLSKTEIISTSLHEAAHKIQFFHMKRARLDLDSDVDVYSKDEFLAIHLGHEEYYKNNYMQITYEDDARYKAELELYKLRKGTPDGLFAKMRREIIKGARDNRRVLKEIEFKTGSLYKTKRFYKNKKYPLDLLFDIKLKEIHNDHLIGGTVHHFIQETLEEHPIIGYEYHLTEDTCERKDITEILYDYMHAGNELDKKIYRALIHSYIDPDKHYDCIRNIKYVRRLLKETSLNEDLRDTLRECLNTNQKQVKYAKELRK